MHHENEIIYARSGRYFCPQSHKRENNFFFHIPTCARENRKNHFSLRCSFFAVYVDNKYFMSTLERDFLINWRNRNGIARDSEGLIKFYWNMRWDLYWKLFHSTCWNAEKFMPRKFPLKSCGEIRFVTFCLPSFLWLREYNLQHHQ